MVVDTMLYGHLLNSLNDYLAKKMSPLLLLHYESFALPLRPTNLRLLEDAWLMVQHVDAIHEYPTLPALMLIFAANDTNTSRALAEPTSLVVGESAGDYRCRAACTCL